jgi:hypothetical protein
MISMRRGRPDRGCQTPLSKLSEPFSYIGPGIVNFVNFVKWSP